MGTKHKMVLVAAAVLVTACTTSPVADARFVTTLMSHHIPGDRFVEIGAAQELCDAWRHLPKGTTLQMPSGSQAAEVQDAMNTMTSQGLSSDQQAQFILDAMDAECPDVRRAPPAQ
jgi:hypothetical protein